MLVLDTDEIVFTTATSPSKHPSRGDYAAFFARHSNPEAFAPALAAQDVAYSTFRNEWGAGRMVLVPGRDARGRRYLFGASVQLQEFDAMLLQTLLRSMGVGAGVLLLAGLGGVALAGYFSRPILALTRSASRMAAGRLDEPIPVGGSREISELGRSLAAMGKAVARRLAEVRASEENLSITLHSIGDGVIVTDARGRVTRMNPVAERLTGWRAVEAAGRELDSVFRIVNAQTRETVESPVKRVLAEGRIVGLANHTILVARDEQERQIADSGAPIRDAAGNLVGVVLVFRDVTREHRLQEQLQHSQKMQAVGELAGGIAHDFNNLLTTILGNAELLEMELADRGEERERARNIQQAALRGSDLTQQLLGFARRGRMRVLQLDIHDAVGKVIGLLTRSIDPRIEIRSKLDADASIVNADLAQIQNALLHLGMNACDAMPDGGELSFESRSLTLAPNACVDEEGPDLPAGLYIELRVRDTGRGMDEETRKRMFEPFFTTKTDGQSTGLGLAAVYGTVTGHNGSIAVSSQPGVGTEICIRLPAQAAPDKPAPVDAGLWTAAPAQRDARGVVLVVEDEEDVRAHVVHVLRGLGYEVEACRDGVEALEQYGRRGPSIDLVLLDQRMPRLSGRETFKRLKEIDPQVRVLLCTGYSRGDVMAELHRLGVLDCVSKPFRMEELARQVARYIRAPQTEGRGPRGPDGM